MTQPTDDLLDLRAEEIGFDRALHALVINLCCSFCCTCCE